MDAPEPADKRNRPPTGSEPLGSTASAEEIQARIEHLRSSPTLESPEQSSAAWPPTAPIGEAPAPDQGAVAVATPTSSKPRARTRRGLAAIGAAAAVLGGLAFKLIAGLFAASVVGATLTAAFGGAYDRLPASERQQLEARLEAAVGDRLKGLSDSDAAAKVNSLQASGMGRLDDASLVEFETIWSSGLGKVDGATCAKVARIPAGSTLPPDALDKILGTLESAQVGRFFEIAVAAVEAEAKAAPPLQTASPQQADAMYAALGAQLSQVDVETLQAYSDGKQVTDPDLCAAYRHLYAAGMALDPTNRAIFARVDVTP
jgi:hypothetical protein